MSKKWVSLLSFLSGYLVANAFHTIKQGDAITAAVSMFFACYNGFLAYREYKTEGD